MLNLFQPFLLEWEGYIKCHDSVPVVLSPPIKWKCPWSQGYAFLKVLTLNIWLHEAKPQDESKGNQDSCPEISKYWQYIWTNDWIFQFSSTPACSYPKLKWSWWVPWLGNHRHNKLPEVMTCSTTNTNITMYVFLTTSAQGPPRVPQCCYWQIVSFQCKIPSRIIFNSQLSVLKLPYVWHLVSVCWTKWND